MKTKKNIVYLVVMIALLITVVGAYTFAFVGSNKEITGKLNTTVSTGIASSDNGYSYKGTSGQIFLSMSNTDFSGEIGEIKNKELTLLSYLQTKNSSRYECTYDIYYKWDNNSDVYTVSGSNEFTFSLDGGTEINFVASSNKTPQKINTTSLKIINSKVDNPTEIKHTITTKFYKTNDNQMNNSSKIFLINFYIDNVSCNAKVGTTLVKKLSDAVASSDSVAAGINGNLQKQTVSVTQNATLGINSSSYTNIIYTGINPNNFIEFNGEMWRIIGVYNEDSHGIANTKLVKIIRNDNLIVSSADTSAKSARYDYKNGYIGSGNNSLNGSNEWSDSQLMFMLNGESALKKGKIYNGTQYTYTDTKISGNYIQGKSNSGTTYYNMWNISKGNYLSYNSYGEAYTNKTIYASSQTTYDGYSELTAVLEKTLSRDAQSKIEEISWHLGGPETYNNSTKNRVSGYYTYERSTYANTNTTSYSTSSIQRNVMWSGKVGLMYVSDFGYATIGGSTTSRASCLSQQMYGWSSYSNCYTNDWLLYVGSTSSSNGTATSQWTMTPYSARADDIFYINTSGRVYYNDVSSGYAIRPVVYIKSGALVQENGDGSYDNPYKFE